MARRRSTGIPGLSFSLKRATGVTAAKRKISKATGIPLSKAGRRAKVGRMAGCLIPTLILMAIPVILLITLL